MHGREPLLLVAVAGERAPARVREAPADHRARLDVEHEQALLETRRASQHLALVVDDDRVAVEDQLVLAADEVAEGEEARVVARARDEHLLALAIAPDVERRRRDVHDQLGARERQVGRGRPRLPDVLADRRARPACRRARAGRARARTRSTGPRRRRRSSAGSASCSALHLAVRQHGARVEEVAVEPRRADERGEAVRRARRAPRSVLSAARTKPGRSSRSSGG